MPIWKTEVTTDMLNAHSKGNMCEFLGIIFTEVGDDYITATMPVDERTTQIMGILHGGASCALAESLGSIAGFMCVEPGHHCVGLDINANHIRAGKPPYVTATTKPLHIGRTTQVWEIRISDADEKLVCISRLTLAVIKSDYENPLLKNL